MRFEKAIRQRKVRGECCCWDHIRLAGLTPPRGSRGEYPAMYPHTVFGEDAEGEPVRTHGKGKREEGEYGVGESYSENSDLREAVRNRSVI